MPKFITVIYVDDEGKWVIRLVNIDAVQSIIQVDWPLLKKLEDGKSVKIESQVILRDGGGCLNCAQSYEEWLDEIEDLTGQDLHLPLAE